MKTLPLIFATLALSATIAVAETNPRWIRQNSISPDGQKIAFVYQGDIFIVSSEGGEAMQLTTNEAHDTEPIWSPDGKYIVFASYREASKDIWAMPSKGGTPYRLTDFGGRETPFTISPQGRLYFGANIQEDLKSNAFPGDNKLYSIDFQKSLDAAMAGKALPTPVGELPFTISNLSINAEGTILYEDLKGYEDSFRKHHTSAVTRDIWQKKDGQFSKLTDFPGEDRNPVWAPDGKSWYYLSEQGDTRKGGPNGEITDSPQVDDWGGDSNIYKNDGTRLTFFEKNPVRYLSISNDGLMAFSWNGDLYTLREGSEPGKLAISLRKDKEEKEHIWKSVSGGADDMAISPDGKEIAIGGSVDVFATTLELGVTLRITDTPDQERGVSFGKDGRSIYYASERGGEWGIYRTILKDKKDKYFTFASEIEEERISPAGEICFQPMVSPDGEKVAYLRNRAEIVVANADGSKPKTLLKGANFSYSDGDLPFEWSPDSRWILTTYQGGGRMYNEDIALINVEDGTLTDLTESGYSDVAFRWAMGGKAMTWESDKAGYRSHGSWGAEGDIYIMFLDDEAFMEFTKSEDVSKIEKLLKSEKEEKKEAKKEERDSAKAAKGKVEPLKMELSRREDRTLRLTHNSGVLGDHWLTPDGQKLYYSVRLEKSMDLCCLDIKKGDIKVIDKDLRGRFYPAPDGESFFVLGSKGVKKIEAKSGSSKNVDFRGEYEYFPDKEREYIFEHCWTQVREKFYVEDMHGVDWEAVGENYRQFLPYITDNYAFQELLSEMLGELNGSHTGGRYYDGTGVSIGYVGVLFDPAFDGPGLKIAEFLPGSVLLTSAPSLKEGDIIMSIDAKPIPAGQPWYKAFERKAGKRVLLTIKSGKDEVKLYITPSSSDSQALYTRWVRRNEQKVKELSGGRIGYVHVKGMNSPSFREVYSKALGKYRGCDALIVDTRHNGGGWLHNDLAVFLNARLYTERRPRGVEMSPEPYDKWIKPSCVLVCEDNYSDACGFPYLYRSLGIGKIIGAPVAGTATSVWWERQVDPTLIFGVPQVGSWSVSEGRFLENHQLEPDIVVYNDPASVMAGEDKQLEAAVAEMLKASAK